MPNKVPPPRKSEEIHPEALIKVIKEEPKDNALEEKRRAAPRREARLPKGIWWGIAGLVVVFVGGSVISFYVIKAKVKESVATNIATLTAGVADLQNFEPQSAAQEFSLLANASSSNLNDVVNIFGSLFKGGSTALNALTDLSGQLTTFSETLNDLASTSFQFFMNGQGGPFIADLTTLRDSLDAINTTGNQLAGAASNVGGMSSLGLGDSYLSLTAQAQNAKSFLDAFIPWLSETGSHHLLVLLQNPSELRASGGFLGSYADVTITNGNVTAVDVHDIADVDVTFTPKIVPPVPLQLEVTKMRPADANWFFDFPTTASETIGFFEESGLYAKSSTTFDGAIAVSPQVVSDLLSLTGPIAVGKPTTTFTADNFLVQVQKIVQDGQATSATYPKQVIGQLAKAIAGTFASATSTDRGALLTTMLNWINEKDVMVYFKDPAMESAIDAYGASGAVYSLPERFNGDYLAVTDTNINGGKSDLYVSSTVNYTAQINPDGTLTDQLAITRKDNANQSPYWWYKVTNEDYAQIFVPEGTTLTNTAGTVTKKITPPLNYAANGYTTDPIVAAIALSEQTLFAYPGVAWHEESGKEVLTTWSTVKAGGTTQFSIDYTHNLFTPPADGVQYQFVFEKQAGTARHYVIEIDAPLGYGFVENGGLATYDYTTDDLPGRMIVNLTLQKL